MMSMLVCPCKAELMGVFLIEWFTGENYAFVINYVFAINNELLFSPRASLWKLILILAYLM